MRLWRLYIFVIFHIAGAASLIDAKALLSFMRKAQLLRNTCRSSFAGFEAPTKRKDLEQKRRELMVNTTHITTIGGGGKQTRSTYLILRLAQFLLLAGIPLVSRVWPTSLETSGAQLAGMALLHLAHASHVVVLCASELCFELADPFL